MILGAGGVSGVLVSFPRTRGDDPKWRDAVKAAAAFSPHPRG